MEDLTNALHKNPVDTADGLPSLDWITRLKIATGVAEALQLVWLRLCASFMMSVARH